MSAAVEQRPSELAQRRGRTAAHEAGHAVAHYLLDGRVGHVSIRGTLHWSGVTASRPRKVPDADLARLNVCLPWIKLPPRIRALFEVDALCSLCGPFAARVYGPELARHPRAGAAPAREEPHRPDLPAVERRALEDGNNPKRKPLENDHERARENLRTLSPDDADLLLELFQAIASRFVAEPEFGRGVLALGPALLEKTDLSSREVRSILSEATQTGRARAA
jgi:hypothetical protein